MRPCSGVTNILNCDIVSEFELYSCPICVAVEYNNYFSAEG